MQKQILINAEPRETRVVVLEGNTLQDYFVERPGYRGIVGNIYKGRVDAIVHGLAAAFIDIGLEKDGFLYAGDVATETADHLPLEFDETLLEAAKRGEHCEEIGKLLKKNQELLVQVEKEAIGTKGPRITQYISIPGRFLVLMPLQKRHIGISRRIEGEERIRIKKILGELRIPDAVGLIVRTAAQGASLRDFIRELKFLLKIWGRIKNFAQREHAPKLVYEEYDLTLRVVRDLFTEEIETLLVDSNDEYRRIMKFLKMVLPGLRTRLRLYRGSKGIFEEFAVEREIERLYGKKVQLRSKGTIVIEQTESLVAIDVNTASFSGKKNPEETAFATNMEAATEIARQIRLRDMGGIIIIDFIDMELREHRHRVHQALQQALKTDKAKTDVLSVSSIGVVEMTRQRIGRSIQATAFQECPYCRGEGTVRSVSTISIEVFRKLKKLLSETRSRDIDVVLHPDVYNYLVTQDKAIVSYIQHKYHCRLNIKSDPSHHIEDIHIAPALR